MRLAREQLKRREKERALTAEEYQAREGTAQLAILISSQATHHKHKEYLGEFKRHAVRFEMKISYMHAWSVPDMIAVRLTTVKQQPITLGAFLAAWQ